ncbi:MAG: hypothetical protein H8D45_01715, partial [Bacteroidetes bacterium]|nr:hypothetical protein [Bacteroidota bacterium]
LYSQEYHTPEQILLLLSKSNVTYTIESVDSDDLEKTETESKLVQHGIYLFKDKDGHILLNNYDNDYASDQDLLEDLQKAEKYFFKGYYEDARGLYKEILEKMPQNSQMMTFIGQSYGIEKEYDKAEKWYKKAIGTNYLDYMAHWFLADIYYIKEKYKKASDEILIAHVLNRNNPRIIDKMNVILKSNNLKYQDWKFDPGCSISEESEGKISLKYDKNEEPEWMMYMLCKALWAYEPGYKESMLENTRELSRIVEEKECLTAMAMGHKNKNEDEPSKIEALKVFMKSLENGNASEYILYEIIMKENPLLPYMIEQKKINDIVKYLLQFRIE